MYIDLLTSKQFSDRLSFNMRLTTLLSQIECYKDVILDGNFKKNLKNTLNAKRKEEVEKIKAITPVTVKNKYLSKEDMVR